MLCVCVCVCFFLVSLMMLCVFFLLTLHSRYTGNYNYNLFWLFCSWRSTFHYTSDYKHSCEFLVFGGYWTTSSRVPKIRNSWQTSTTARHGRRSWDHQQVLVNVLGWLDVPTDFKHLIPGPWVWRLSGLPIFLSLQHCDGRQSSCYSCCCCRQIVKGSRVKSTTILQQIMN